MKRVLLPLLLVPGTAFAHTGHAGDHPFLSGLTHPALGADHLLAMVAVGLWAAVIGGRAMWALPSAFVSAMLLGGMLGSAGAPLPGVEPMILASVVALGALTALALQPGLAAAVAFVALFGLFHGHAHGAEGPVTGLDGYAAGFVLTTMALHLVGVMLGRLAQGALPRVIGALTAVAGVALAMM
ncbi:MAG: HupE/UreJ family protein [Gemmobacter sp.]